VTGHRSQRAARDHFKRRVQAVADLAEAGEGDVLLVSHAGMMAYLRAELVRRGFRGPQFRIAEHARLYVFER
jgi:broad specificity phosphatase PhoE